MAHKMTSIERTEGDGMENVVEATCENILPSISHIKIDKPVVTKSPDSKTIGQVKLVSLKAVGAPQRKVSVSSIGAKPKEPKFVPYEPYKAAVRPIIPPKKLPIITKKMIEDARSRNESCSSDFLETKVTAASSSLLGDEMKTLKLENEELEKQLQLQVQVNAELKNLLVAAVGEDMETRVNCLAEDKQHLAQKLINSAKTLSSHHEQVEWLASQCEVWRSKFLASSVMVEELARWKASLAHKIFEGEKIMKSILDERRIARKNLLTLYSSLVVLRDNFDLLSKKSAVKSSNVLDLSSKCNEMAKGLVIQLLGGMATPSLDLKIAELPEMTNAEKAADHMLKHPHLMNLIGEPDAACHAVVGAAVALHSQMYHQMNPPRITSCVQCSGEMHLV